MTTLTLQNLRKSYGTAEVIKGVDLEIADGEFVVFVGPSGCGKSTLLRMIAGLEEITGGALTIGGARMNDVPPAKRGVAMVFQSYALYPHLTVRENIGFGLKVRRLRPPEIAVKVAEAAASLQLDTLLERYPRELSGGQRQRVAIGRAIVSDPDVFLFDEPLSNLDAELRVHMRGEIAELHGRLKNTMIYVTHDQVEAMTLADKIVVLRDGQIEQVGTPKDLYEEPANIFVAQFIGSPKMNILPFDRATLPTRLLPLEGEHGANTRAAPTHFGMRPEHIEAVPVGAGDVDVTVVMSEYLGADRFLRVATPEGVEFMVRASGKSDVVAGHKIGLTYDPGSIHFFDANGHRVVA